VQPIAIEVFPPKTNNLVWAKTEKASQRNDELTVGMTFESLDDCTGFFPCVARSGSFFDCALRDVHIAPGIRLNALLIQGTLKDQPRESLNKP
jgi:hypothetical protein